MQPVHPTHSRGIIRQLLRRGKTPGDRHFIPPVFLAVVAAAVMIQLVGSMSPGWTSAVIYNRPAIESGQLWRLWTGHLVHYGWLHFAADTGILLYLGRVITWPHPVARLSTLVIMPLIISAGIYLFDPEMIYYAGLSALNLGLFVFHSLNRWRRDTTDWLWPAVLLVCIAEITYESIRGGSGGGLISFSDPSVRIATIAHLTGGVSGLALWILCRPRRPTGPSRSELTSPCVDGKNRRSLASPGLHRAQS